LASLLYNWAYAAINGDSALPCKFQMEWCFARIFFARSVRISCGPTFGSYLNFIVRSVRSVRLGVAARTVRKLGLLDGNISMLLRVTA
jgi:hypothetical protein